MPKLTTDFPVTVACRVPSHVAEAIRAAAAAEDRTPSQLLRRHLTQVFGRWPAAESSAAARSAAPKSA